MATTPSPLQRTANEFPTDYWNDSCNKAELEYAIERGAVVPIRVHAGGGLL